MNHSDTNAVCRISKRNLNSIRLLIAACALSGAASAFAAPTPSANEPKPTLQDPPRRSWQLSLGAATTYGTSFYFKKKAALSAVPIINFKSGGFTSTGYAAEYVVGTPAFRIGPELAYASRAYKSKDSERLKGMDDRAHRIYAGLIARMDFVGFQSEVRAQHDLMLNGGMRGSVAVKFPFVMPVGKGNAFIASPSVAFAALANAESQYLYGVNSEEVDESRGRTRYAAKSAMTQKAELMLAYVVAGAWTTFVSGGYTHANKAIKNSPLVDRSSATSGVAGMSYSL